MLAPNTWYWFASVDNDSTLTWKVLNASTPPLFSQSNGASALGYSVAHTYGTLPNPYTTGGTAAGLGTTSFPLILVKFSTVN